MSEALHFRQARVVGIVNVADANFAALVFASHLDHDDKPLFGSNYNAAAPGAQTLALAEEALFEPAHGAGGRGASATDLQDPGDLDGYLRASGADEARTGLAFDSGSEQVFDMRTQALLVRAECIVEAVLSEQTDANAKAFVRAADSDNYTPAPSAAVVDEDFDYDSDDACAPATRTETVVAAPVREVRRRFIVQGLFCALSPCVPLDIAARPFSNNGQAIARGALPRFDSLQKGCGIVPAARSHVSLWDVRDALLHGSRMHPTAINAVLRRMVPRAFGLPAQARAAEMDAALHGPRGPGSKLDRRAPLTNTVTVTALRHAFVRDGWPLSLITLMPDKKAAFSLPLLLMYTSEVRQLAIAYTRRHWPGLVARGVEVVERVAKLARITPYVLAVDLLKYRAAIAAKSELDEKAVHALRSNQGASVQRYWEHASNATRQIAALPELTWASFARLCRGKSADAPPYVGIDIYKNIMLADLGGMRGLDKTPQMQRARATPRGATSNHMFTVLGDDAERLDDDQYDAAHADGTFCLDEWRAPPASQANELLGVDNVPEADGRLTVRPFVPQSALAASAAAPARATLRDARRRCDSTPTDEQFVAGLRWLLDEQIVHRETRRGTGPYNEGRAFDVYYTLDMWRTQRSLVDAIAGIYERGMRARLHANVALSAEDRERRAAAFDEWVAVRHTARRQLASLVHARASLRAKRNKRKRPGAQDDDDDAADPYEQVAALRDALKQEHVRAMAALDRCAPIATPDPYELAGGVRRDDVAARHRLVQRKDPLTDTDRDDGVELTDEQTSAVRHALLNPITIFMSPGGCGKTETAVDVVGAYSRDQVLLVAQTAKAKLVLEERVGPASTIHSVLLRETTYRQSVKRAARRWVRLGRRQQSAPPHCAAPTADSRAAAADLAFDVAFAECERLVGVADARSPFENKRLLLLDEASLADAELVCKLLAFAPPQLEKFIVLGDVDQLGSIGAGAVLRDLCHALPHCTKLFTQNFRSDGRAIFDLARNIVLRRAPTAQHDFDPERNAERLRTPTSYRVDALRDSTVDVEARKARAEDASLVFIAAKRHTLDAELARTLIALGAAHDGCDDPCELTEEQRAAMFTARERMHIIAPTNKLATQCNSVFRAVVNGAIDPFATIGHPAEAHSVGRELPAKYARRLLRHDKMFFRTNFRDAYMVRETAIATAIENHPSDVTEEELEADDVDKLCPALASEHGAAAASRVEQFVEETAGAVPGAVRLSRRFQVPSYNSEILTVVDFYNTAIAVKASDNCVCGTCDPREVSAARQLCVLLPHRVPPGRRALQWRPAPASYQIECHDHHMRAVGGTAQSTEFKRMVVLRTQAGAYKHVSVEARVGDRSTFDFGFATTVHRYQGSGVDTVILVLPYDSDFNDRLLTYTAVTRAAKRFIVIGEPHAWRAACARTPATRRSELWLELAREVQRVHAALGGVALADALGVGDPLERELLSLDKAALRDAPRMWTYFPRTRRAALERAQLADL